ncbi:MAG TPA: Rieske (2Fe-2S) protein, partial [Usitatibacter sp.]|nr:Rieske (2Fe-2S) protein [Usitatibacter sp.]
MSGAPYAVDADITVASTLESRYYLDAEAYERTRERVFARSWQWIGALDAVAAPESLAPRTLGPGVLDEPVLLARDAAGELRCLSNVCTHRGNILVAEACRAKQIRCGYHSRRFDLAGRMSFMPEFEAARDFPAASDHLPQVPFAQWAGHGFASVAPAAGFDEFFGELRASVAALPLDRM